MSYICNAHCDDKNAKRYINNVRADVITVKPRFNVPAFSEIPDLVTIFSCPDNSSTLIENLHLMKTLI